MSNKKTRNTAAEMLPMATCSARLRLMYENPEPSSLQNPVRASTATASNPGRRLRNAADTRNDAESTANATLGPQRPTRSPPMAGPTTFAVWRPSWETELAAIRSVSGTVLRIVACSAGLNSVPKVIFANTRASSTKMLGAKISPRTMPARARSQPTMTTRFGQRSARTPEKGATTAAGTAIEIANAARAAAPKCQR